MQGTRVRALVREDPTWRRAAKPVRHNYWACDLEPASYNYWSLQATTTEPAHLESMLRNKRSHRNEKHMHHNEEYPFWPQGESPCAAMKTQCSQK